MKGRLTPQPPVPALAKAPCHRCSRRSPSLKGAETFGGHQSLKVNLNWPKSSLESYTEQGEPLFASQKKALLSDKPLRVLPALFHRHPRNLQSLAARYAGLILRSPCRPCWVLRIPLFTFHPFTQPQLQQEEISDSVTLHVVSIARPTKTKEGKAKN